MSKILESSFAVERVSGCQGCGGVSECLIETSSLCHRSPPTAARRTHGKSQPKLHPPATHPPLSAQPGSPGPSAFRDRDSPGHRRCFSGAAVPRTREDGGLRRPHRRNRGCIRCRDHRSPATPLASERPPAPEGGGQFRT